LQEMYGHFW